MLYGAGCCHAYHPSPPRAPYTKHTSVHDLAATVRCHRHTCCALLTDTHTHARVCAPQLIKCELEKEQLETDLRAELAAEAQALLQEQRAATERAEEQAAMWRARAEELAGKLAAHDAAAAAVAEAALQQEAARIAQVCCE